MNSKSKELTHNMAVKSIRNKIMTIHHEIFLSLVINGKIKEIIIDMRAIIGVIAPT